MYSNKVAYLQLTLLVYGSSPPESYEQSYLDFSHKPWKKKWCETATLLKMI